MEQASSDAMAARDALPVLSVLFLFLAVRNRSFLSGRERKEWVQKNPPVCVERRQLPLGRGDLVSLNVYVVIDMVDAIAVVAIAL